jgi:tetratricopeptide (TPR) repeat protein
VNINNEIKSAMENYQAGNLQKTVNICKKIVKIQPNNINALNLLGIICYQIKDYDSAIKYSKKLINLNPGNARTYYILGHSMQEKGETDEAITHYQRSLQLDPNFADAYYNLGTILQDNKRYDEAISCYKKSLQLNPNDVDAYYNLARVLQEKEQFDEAITCYKKALQINPNLADAYNNIGTILIENEQFDEALTNCQKAFYLNPNLPDVHNNLGIINKEKGKLDEAIFYCQKALQLDSRFYKAYHNLANIQCKKQQFDKAVTYSQQALEINPNDDEVHVGLGAAFCGKGQLNTGINCYKKAIQINSNNANTHFSMSCAFLLSGDFKQGWQEYEWRWKSKDYLKYNCFHKPDDFSQPILKGLDIAGQTVFIYAEQGLGDEIQFIRYVPLVVQLGANVVIECHKELYGLLQSIEGIKHLIVQGEQLPEFDIQCPLLTLPLVFNTTLENIPTKVPYLSVNPILTQKWKDKIQQDNSKLKVGLVWQGNPKHKNDMNRSIPFNYFSPFSKFTDITFYSLQKGKGSEQSKNLPVGIKFIDLTEEINDFSDTAALIENLDLTISVDTSVVHLAGALGKPIWTLLPFSPDWRWMLTRKDSPWYPTMRLFRQPSPGDWNSVIKKVAEELVYFQGHHT